MNKEQSKYLLPLSMYQSAYNFDLSNKHDFLSFKLGFNAICQITLNAPILPFQNKHSSHLLFETEINARFMDLINFSKSVSPPKSQDDYCRYIDELTTRKLYKSLESSYSEIEKNKKNIFNNFLTEICKEKEYLFLSAQKEYKKNKINYYYFLSGQYTSPRAFCMKYSDNKLDLPINKLLYCFQELQYQYYTELLYGYKANILKNQIIVCPIVELSDYTINNLQFLVDDFNSILKLKSVLLPKMILTK